MGSSYDPYWGILLRRLSAPTRPAPVYSFLRGRQRSNSLPCREVVRDADFVDFLRTWLFIPVCPPRVSFLCLLNYHLFK